MVDGLSMLARCPACSSRFGVVGSCQLPCPFCGESLSVRLQRQVSPKQVERVSSGRARAEVENHTDGSSDGGLNLVWSWRPPPDPEPEPHAKSKSLWASLKAWWARPRP